MRTPHAVWIERRTDKPAIIRWRDLTDFSRTKISTDGKVTSANL